jgi:hypothetical protein
MEYIPQKALHNHRCVNLRSYILNVCSLFEADEDVPNPRNTNYKIIFYNPVLKVFFATDGMAAVLSREHFPIHVVFQ